MKELLYPFVRIIQKEEFSMYADFCLTFCDGLRREKTDRVAIMLTNFCPALFENKAQYRKLRKSHFYTFALFCI